MSLAAQTFSESRFEVPSPSVDSFGRITFVPTVKNYRPATEELIGKKVDIITDLNTSEVMRIKRNGRNAKQLIS